MRNYTTKLPDGPAVIGLKPGIKEPDAANEVLFSAIRSIQDDQVFVTGPGSLPSVLWAARTGAAVSVWTENDNYASCLEHTFKLAGLPTPTMHLQAGFDGIQTQHCGLAILHLPRGRLLQLESLQLAAAVLREGGKLVFVGAKREGVKTALKIAKDTYQQAGIVAQKGGYHVGFAQRPPGDFPLPELSFTQVSVSIGEEPTLLFSCPGVFAAGRVDAGAEALISGMPDPPGDCVLDLGCGTGMVGLTALRRGAHVTLTDVSARAVESARRSINANGYDAPVIHTSGAEKCAAGTFDTVYVNPPFHKGYGVDYETTRYLLDQTLRALAPNGKMYLVANTFLKYEQWIQNTFGNVRVVYQNSQFRVWQGTKQ